MSGRTGAIDSRRLLGLDRWVTCMAVATDNLKLVTLVCRVP